MPHRSIKTPGHPAQTTTSPPQPESPRARLLRRGPAALADAEVIALLLRTGGRESSALAVAHDLLDSLGGLAGLLGASAGRLRRKGIGEARASVLIASLELARRLARLKVPERKPMDRPGYVAAYLALRYFSPDQEVIGALFVDARNRLIADQEFFRGSLSNATFEPRPMLKEGLLRGAAGLILFHTHPSGDPMPSPQDRTATRRLEQAGRIVGVRLIDHLIVTGRGRWHSMRGNGGW